MSFSLSFMEHFADLPDPRVERTKLHNLLDILVITLCAVISGAEGWGDIAQYGRSKHDWLKTFLALPNGIPTDDTFARVFARLDPEAFARCFALWTQSIKKKTRGQVVAIDGKSLRHSFDTATGKAAIQMVSAWAGESRLVLAQQKVDTKSNEITAIPCLLELLDLTGHTGELKTICIGNSTSPLMKIAVVFAKIRLPKIWRLSGILL